MWNRTRERAAELIAAGDLRSEQIAKELGISDRSLRRWKQEPEFEERVKALILQWRTKVASTGIAVRENRIAGYERRRNWLEQIRRERAAAPEMQGIPGGSTGLIVRRIKSVGFGENNRLVDVYAVDTGFLRELRELEKQAAIECGHWEQHVVPAGQPQEVVVMVLPNMPPPVEEEPRIIDVRAQK